MKKFMKFCGITALVMLVAGAVLGILGGAVAGAAAISQVVDSTTKGWVHVDLGSNPIDWGITVKDRDIFPFEDDDDMDIGSFDKDYEIFTEDVGKYCPGDNISNLDIEVGGGSFEIKESQDESIYVSASNTGKFQGYVEGDTLYIKAVTSSTQIWRTQNCKIILYLPEKYSFDEVEIELGAGTVYFDGLTAQTAKLEVGAGQINLKDAQIEELEIHVGAGQAELQNMWVGELDVEVGMGRFTADGAIYGDVDIQCSMGNVELEIDGSEDDYNYHLTGAMGNVDLGKNSFSGFSQKRDIDNNADKDMVVDCSMGNISIWFDK